MLKERSKKDMVAGVMFLIAGLWFLVSIICFIFPLTRTPSTLLFVSLITSLLAAFAAMRWRKRVSKEENERLRKEFGMQ